MLELGFISDEVSRDLNESIEICNSWGITRFELREGSEGRFPAFTKSEIETVESALSNGNKITAVSPGTFKSSIEDKTQIELDLTRKLPKTIELAKHFHCSTIITFGCIRLPHEPEENRIEVLHLLDKASKMVAQAGLILALENEPPFWANRMQETVDIVKEVDNPNLLVNWDPANLHWGGKRPTYEDFQTIKPYITNVHVKDFTPDDKRVPWRVVGEGITPWAEILPWILAETNLAHVTLETHIEPWKEMSEKTLANFRTLLENYYQENL